ncbi:hypothetical protein CHCC20335_0912 [Bacillus paralicheniformis]|nr:hypothetical protein CHCC20335_0912 [Bacillus paralicheniformis]
MIDRDMTRENAPGTGADKERQYRGDYIPFEAGSGNQSLEKKESAPFKSREYIRVEKR